MSEKLSIHRALSEMKLIDSKINTALETIEPTGAMQTGKLVNNHYQKADFEKDAKAKFQRIQDLITRKNIIKKAIVQKNAEVQVKIGNKTMSIADAISFKAIVDIKQKLIDTLKSKNNKTKSTIERYNTQVDASALNIAGKAMENSNIKIGDKDAAYIIDPYVKTHEIHLVDPLKVEKTIETLQNELEEFVAEVDAVLSEANALNKIEI